MLGCDMSFTLAALNHVKRRGQAVKQCSSSQMILLLVIWE